MENFVVKPSDIEWMNTMIRIVKIGGTWASSMVAFDKTEERELTLVMVNSETFTEHEIKDFLGKTKAVCEQANIELIVPAKFSDYSLE